MRALLTNRNCLLFSGLAAMVVTFYLVFLNPVPDFYPQQENDPFTYLSLAKGLIDGEGYPTKHWMPGFPAFLAVAISILGQNFALLKLWMLLFAFLAVCSSYAYFASFLPRRDACWLAMLVAISPSFFSHSHRLMSEIPCLAFSMLALATTELISRMTYLSTRRQWLLIGTLWFASVIAVMIRGNALALAPALIAASIATWRNVESRSWKPATAISIAGLLVFIAFGAWTARNRTQTYDGIHNVTYLQEVQADDIGKLWDSAGNFENGAKRATPIRIANRVRNNICWYLVYHISDCIFPGSSELQEVETGSLGFLVATLITSLVVVGWLTLWRHSVAGAIYLLLSLALIAVYPTGGAERMLVPSIPLIMLSGYFGLRLVLGKSIIKGWLCSMAVLGIICIIVDGDRQARHPYSFDAFADFVAAIDQANNRFDRPGTLIVSHRCAPINALTDFDSTNELSSAVDKFRSKEVNTVLIIDFEEFEPSSELPTDIHTKLEIEHGAVRVHSLRTE